MEMSLYKIDELCYLQFGGVRVPIKNYKILSSMHGSTELEVVIELNDNIMEFSIKARTG